MLVLTEEQSIGYSQLMKQINDKLDLLGPVNDARFTDNIWQFKNKNHIQSHIITLDFGIFNNDYLQPFSAIEVVFSETKIPLSMVDFAKLLWLENVYEYKGANVTFSAKYNGICSLFYFLKENDIGIIDKSNLESFYGFLFAFDVTAEGLKKRVTPPAYYSRIGHFQLERISRVLQRYQVQGIVEHITRSKSDKVLNDACISIMDITLTDYKDRSSFNFLGLDTGKHYIDHCANTFEKYFQFATAYEQTMNIIVDVARTKTKVKNESSIKTFAAYVLCGLNIFEVISNFSSWNIETKKDLRNVVFEVFREKYNSLAGISQAFKLQTVNQIILESGLPDRYDSQEFLRSILIAHYVSDFGKKSENIYQEYIAAINTDEINFSMSYDDFIDLVQAIIKKRSHVLPDENDAMSEYLNEVVNNAPHSSVSVLKDKLDSIHHHIQSAGLTFFVALTGWRRTEFGFPLSAVNVSVNNDVLDNLYTPWRFHINWFVPKTSGKTPLNRELTSYAYQIALMLDKLNTSMSERPALYKPGIKTKSSGYNSSGFVYNRCQTLWIDFIVNYSVFNELDELERLAVKSKLNSVERSNLHKLKRYYDLNNSQTKTIIEIRNNLRDALPRYRVTTDTGTVTLGTRIDQYVKGSLDEELAIIFDKFLSAETKEKLRNGEYPTKQAMTTFVRSELLENDVYPTPHAFRHIWAEAVLQRYRGDVGKFIRANFKHLDERFFMAYLRNKETKAVFQVATRTVINSIVRQKIKAMTDNSREFSGGFDRFLSKAVKFTKVVSQNELEELVTNISEHRVIDMKSTPWASCFLRTGTEKIAKCSEDGVPQRRNAEPKLCLGCVNADIAEGNFNGIVVYIKHDIAACRNPKLPLFIKEPNIATVKFALKRVEQLKKNSNNPKYDKFISYLKETLEISSISQEVP